MQFILGGFGPLLAAADVLPSWTQYGLAGLIFLGFVTGQIVPGFIFKRKEHEAAEKDVKIEALNKLILEKVIPAVLESDQARRELLELLQGFQRESRK